MSTQSFGKLLMMVALAMIVAIIGYSLSAMPETHDADAGFGASNPSLRSTLTYATEGYDYETPNLTPYNDAD